MSDSKPVSSTTTNKKSKNTNKKFFQLSVVTPLNNTESDIQIIRDSKPNIRLTLCKKCLVCDVLHEFFGVKHKDNCVLEEVEYRERYHEHGHHTIEYFSDSLEGGSAFIDLNFDRPAKASKKKAKLEEAGGATSDGVTEDVSIKPASKKVIVEKTDDEKYESLLLTRLKREFEKEDKFVPHPQQKDLLERFKTEEQWNNLDKFLLYWSMGSGKTKGMLRLLTQNPQEEVFIVCSNTLLGQWVADIQLMPQKVGQTEFRVVGYTQFSKLVKENPDVVTGKVVIVDEGHHFKNVTQKMLVDLEALAKSRNCFVLTGTPIVNDISDIHGLIKIFSPDFRDFDELTPEFFEELMVNRVSHYDPKIHDFKMLKSYPEVETVIKKLPMDWNQTMEYITNVKKDISFGEIYVVRSKGNSYDAQSRLISNSISDNYIESVKFKEMVKTIIELNRYPQVVYSHFLDRGTKSIQKLLTREKPELRIANLDGGIDTKQRKKIMEKYNKGQIDVLFITDAAREGVDLHNTAMFHLTEPCRNRESEAQTVGRVIRFNSHKNASVKKVIVVKYISVFPDKIDKATAKKLEKEFCERYGFENCGTHFVTALKDKMNEIGGCIDEKIESTNTEKFNRIQPYVSILQKIGKPTWPLNVVESPKKKKIAQKTTLKNRESTKTKKNSVSLESVSKKPTSKKSELKKPAPKRIKKEKTVESPEDKKIANLKTGRKRKIEKADEQDEPPKKKSRGASNVKAGKVNGKK